MTTEDLKFYLAIDGPIRTISTALSQEVGDDLRISLAIILLDRVLYLIREARRVEEYDKGIIGLQDQADASIRDHWWPIWNVVQGAIEFERQKAK